MNRWILVHLDAVFSSQQLYSSRYHIEDVASPIWLVVLVVQLVGPGVRLESRHEVLQEIVSPSGFRYYPSSARLTSLNSGPRFLDRLAILLLFK